MKAFDNRQDFKNAQTAEKERSAQEQLVHLSDKFRGDFRIVKSAGLGVLGQTFPRKEEYGRSRAGYIRLCSGRGT